MRIRTIKPEFWQNEELASVSAEACLLAIALLNYADDEGCFNAHPKLVAASCCPLREMDVASCLRELEAIGYIETVSVGSRTLGRIVTFRRHQNIARPSPSSMAKHFSRDSHGALNESSMNAHGGLTEDSLRTHFRKGKERKGMERKQPKVVLGGNAARARERLGKPSETVAERPETMAAETAFGCPEIDLETEEARRRQIASLREGGDA